MVAMRHIGAAADAISRVPFAQEQSDAGVTGAGPTVAMGSPSGHKRKDMVDLGGLERYLAAKGLSHAFRFMFGNAM